MWGGNAGHGLARKAVIAFQESLCSIEIRVNIHITALLSYRSDFGLLLPERLCRTHAARQKCDVSFACHSERNEESGAALLVEAHGGPVLIRKSGAPRPRFFLRHVGVRMTWLTMHQTRRPFGKELHVTLMRATAKNLRRWGSSRLTAARSSLGRVAHPAPDSSSA